MIISLFIFALIISLLTIVVSARIILLLGAERRLVEQEIKRMEDNDTDTNQTKGGLIPDEWLKQNGMRN